MQLLTRAADNAACCAPKLLRREKGVRIYSLRKVT
jgi:hypothetical protein